METAKRPGVLVVIAAMALAGSLVVLGACSGTSEVAGPGSEPTVVRSWLPPDVYRVRDLDPGIFSSYPDGLTELGGALYFTASRSVTDVGLWKTDGSPAGTQLVTSLRPDMKCCVALGDALLVPEFTSDHASGESVRLWRIDPRGREHPQLLGGFSSFGYEAVVGKVAFFSASDKEHGSEPWVTDGTPSGTHVLMDVQAGPAGSSPFRPVVDGARVYFFAYTRPGALGLFRTDGTSAGTGLVRELPDSGVLSPAAGGGRVFFDLRSELWVSDGTAEGTIPLTASDPRTFTATAIAGAALGRTFLFHRGPQLWSTDGTPAGTRLVKDFCPGCPLFSRTTYWVGGMIPFGDAVYFSGGEPATGVELWRTDGTTAGTLLVKDIQPGPGSSGPTYPVAWRGRLYFTANDGIHGAEVWQTDGTEAGTTLLRDVLPGREPSRPYSEVPTLVAAGDHLYFPARDEGSGVELWAYGPAAIPEPIDAPPVDATDHPPEVVGLRSREFGSTGEGVGFDVRDADGDAVEWSAVLSGSTRSHPGFFANGRLVAQGRSASGQGIALQYGAPANEPGDFVVVTIYTRDARGAQGVPQSVTIPVPF
jgi:ELWxxDGT repeat protein